VPKAPDTFDDVQQVEKVFDWMRDHYDKMLDGLGAALREKYIIPVCEKYRVEFVSGNGTFFFLKRKTLIYLEEDAERLLGPDAALALRVLNVEDIRGHAVGYRADTYMPSKRAKRVRK